MMDINTISKRNLVLSSTQCPTRTFKIRHKIQKFAYIGFKRTSDIPAGGKRVPWYVSEMFSCREMCFDITLLRQTI